MNILVIGNGFDLAHGLPTRYTDFLDFVNKFIEIYEKVNKQEIDWGKFNTSNKMDLFFKNFFDAKYINKCEQEAEKKIIVERIEELKNLLDNNIWIEYFLKNPIYEKENWIDFEKENWIDFESEILRIVKEVCKDIKKRKFYNIVDITTKSAIKEELFFNIAIDTLCAKKVQRNDITYKKLRDTLLNDLNRLIRTLEIYLTEYVEKLDCKVESPDIKNALIEITKYPTEEDKKLEGILSKVLCFNYTNTFSKVYKIKITKKIKENNTEFINYIHGKADINNTLESKKNNMVLGIDEYLPDDRKDKDIEFIAFKKFYQRIYKGTGCKYKEWVDKIRDEWENETEENKKEIRKCISKSDFDNENKEKIHRVYIFGHSLDVTDKDILRDLILNDNVYTTIFYLNKDIMGQQIANLVKVIGQDELIKRTGGSTKTLEFRQQQEMILVEK